MIVNLRRMMFSLALPIVLAAAVVPRFSLEGLLDGSQFILEGRVVRSWSGWDAKHKYIWTHYEIQVSESLRGNLSGTTTVSEPGGSVDGINMGASGTVAYAIGEEVILFLYRTPIGFLRTVGAGQGKFTIGKDGRARANMQGMEVADSTSDSNPNSNNARRGTPLSTVEAMSAREFKVRLRLLARSRKAPQAN